ncbi:long-chain fatty acid--CoA ligase [Kibdelosporangium philippinense]|uniref:Long-chain fatty acid--CoA ligase n=1 Tax=Kibdelosporangium philippinense TaxID=211113 RepID=A0ABS8ZWJ9_9PSEU|nr:long-chain fatty acid--CoA ligase [Kibdelosporangium philippinense]MCE7010227.1 long-chain fatty acid--CoA ligase [Kibdelosporangium philippinense]
MNLAANLVRTAALHPDRPAIRLDDTVLTYAQLDDATKRAAGLLAKLGVGPGDRVGIMLPNVPQFAVLYYATLRAGAVVVPMNPMFKEREVAYYLSDSGAKVIFAMTDVPDAPCVVVDESLTSGAPIEGVVDRSDEDTAVIFYTSGTTGQPKGAELTHANLVRNVEIAVRALTQAVAGDVVFGALPLFHVFGQTVGLNVAVAVGGCLTLLSRFDAVKAMEVVQRDKVTVFEGVPTMYVALANHPSRASYDLSSLRVCLAGGAPLPMDVITGFEQAFGCAIMEGYGLSETSPIASFNVIGKRRAGSIGTPVDGVQFRLVDEDGVDVPRGEIGEIVIKGHNVMKGYWAKPDETAKAIRDGWFHTGDLGRQDEDGFYYIVDRKKDMIIRGGYNVYPREIEDVLHEHPAVGEAAVIGVPHDSLGEEVAAFVALKPAATATADELRDFVKGKVAAYKYPRIVRITAELPRNATGKILKRQIKLVSG